MPKGRKDQGEPMHVTAVRETYEETGYPCDLYPCTMHTRAPQPGKPLGPHTILKAQDICEPFAITVYQIKHNTLKTVWWYLTWLKDNSAEKVLNTHASSGEEFYESGFHDVDEALKIMHRSPDFYGILLDAVTLVQKNMGLIDTSTDQGSG